MPTVEATVQTTNAVRYVTQLARHGVAMADGRGHRMRMHGGSNPLADGEVSLQVEQAAHRTTLTFDPWGTCTARAEGGLLMLRVDASDEQSVQRLQDIITRDIERFGRREQLTLAWGRTDQPELAAAKVNPSASATGHPLRAPVLTAAGLGVVLVLVLHVGLGSAVVAGWGWLGWTVVGGLTVGGLALLFAHLAVPVLALRIRRCFVRRRDAR